MIDANRRWRFSLRTLFVVVRAHPFATITLIVVGLPLMLMAILQILVIIAMALGGFPVPR